MELQAALDERPFGIVIHVTGLIDQDRPFGQRRAEELRREALPACSGVGSYAGQIEHRRSQLHVAHAALDSSRLGTGNTNDQRDAYNLLPHLPPVEEFVMFTERLSVISGE